MTSKRKLCIVQFIHPGNEHFPENPPLNNFLDWNSNEHKRKFLRSKGNYVKNDSLIEDKELIFWGEWEPPTNVSSLHPLNDLYPQWLHSRVLPLNITGCFGDLQNTDPYVFDGAFRYFVCQQARLKNILQEGYPLL
jgi:hypothetical protein